MAAAGSVASEGCEHDPSSSFDWGQAVVKAFTVTSGKEGVRVSKSVVRRQIMDHFKEPGENPERQIRNRALKQFRGRLLIGCHGPTVTHPVPARSRRSQGRP